MNTKDNAGDAGRDLLPENRYEAERERMREEEAQLKVRELRVEKLLKSLALLCVGAIYLAMLAATDDGNGEILIIIF